jgi:hypothetical protein
VQIMHVRAPCDRAVRFGIGERFVPPFVPAPPREHPHIMRQYLLDIQTETILDRSGVAMKRVMSGGVSGVLAATASR